jgi:hypothetical protein
MNWLEGLLEPLMDRLALKLANKVRAQLNSGMDSALDRADERIDTAFQGLEERLLAAANKAMADVLQQALRPVADLQQQLQVVAEAVGVTPLEAAKAAGGYVTDEQFRKAAQAAGMIPAADVRVAITSAASSARAAAVDHLRSRLTPPRPWKETPDL